MQKPELISFKLCPFVQRSVITLLEKNIDFAIQYIDLSNKPDWFLAISPLGKVPVLRVGDHALFESNVINEYLDEAYGSPLHPSDALKKAQHRAWMVFAGELQMVLYQLTTANDAETFAEKQARLDQCLAQLESQLSPGAQCVDGEKFALIDTVYAPVFRSMLNVKKFYGRDLLAQYPNLSSLSTHLLQRPSVQNSVADDYDELMRDAFSRRDSYLNQVSTL